MPLIAVVDTETTGIDPGDHRLIEVYAGLWDLDTRELVDAYEQRCHPQRSIQPAAQAVHKISITDLEHCPTFDVIALACRTFIKRGAVVVGHNWAFDLGFLDFEFQRAKVPKLNMPSVDTMLQGRFASPVGAVPNLGALCWACEVEYDPALAHAAAYDVQKTTECFFKGLDWRWFELPKLAVAA